MSKKILQFALLAVLCIAFTPIELFAKKIEPKSIQYLLKNDRLSIRDKHVAEICKDTNIKHLDLSNCQRITDDCLLHVAKLKKLESLDLSWSFNVSSEKVFKLAQQLPKLSKLTIANSRTFSAKNIETLENIKHLDIHRDSGKYDDQSLEQIGKLTKLTHLNLNQSRHYRANIITGAGIKHLENLRNLETLGIYGLFKIKDNEYTQLFKKLSKLKELEMGFNWLFKGDSLVLPAHLRKLDMKESWNVSEEPLIKMKGKSSLRELNIFQCFKFTDNAIASLKNLKQLKKLNMGGNRELSDKSLEYIKNNTGLNYLNICDNEFTDNGIKHLKSLTALEELNLFHNKNLKGPGLSALKSMKKLKTLNLANCYNLTDSAMDHIKNLSQLESLYLNRCTLLSDKTLSQLSGLTSLRELTLEGCEGMTDKGVLTLRSLKNLEYLDLSQCQNVTANSVKQLRKALPKCDIVY